VEFSQKYAELGHQLTILCFFGALINGEVNSLYAKAVLIGNSIASVSIQYKLPSVDRICMFMENAQASPSVWLVLRNLLLNSNQVTRILLIR